MNSSNLKERLQREVEKFLEIEESLSDPAVSGDPERFKSLSREHSRLSSMVGDIRDYLGLMNRNEEAAALLKSETDPELKEMAQEEINATANKLEEGRQYIETLLLPPDPNDGKAVIFEIRAGTGGDEASLFAADLYRMYQKYCEKTGLRLELLYIAETELGGFKEVTFTVSGKEAWQNLKKEAGTHRVQRIPVTESGGRIHTSAVTVSVLPEVEDAEVDVEEKDLRIDVFRASGAGGQHVNKTESAVRITHIPTGMVVSCQDERSQLKNRAKAMKVLKSRLAEKQREERHASEAAAKKEQVKSGDRSERIRTYNFPQGRITDHRIGFTAYNLEQFMQGEIDELLAELIEAEKQDQLKVLEAS